VHDVAPALVTLMEREDINGEVFNIGSSNKISMVDLAKRIIERTGSQSEVVLVPYEKAYGKGYEDMLHREPCLKKINAAIGYQPRVGLDEILDSVIAEMKKREAV
jgi:UDP-glucose 4-epimerase